MQARVLYLNMAPGAPSQAMKLAGIRRYAALRGWEVACSRRGDLRRDGLRATLARFRPDGVVVEGSGRRPADCPPRAFGDLPASFIEYPEAALAGKAPNVVIDDAAVADAAFRELAQGRPSAYAAVGYPVPHLWSRLRVRAFARRCAREGLRCAVFAGRRGEAPESYRARLEAWIAALPPRAAIFVDSDTVAVAATRAARAVRRHVPKDLTVCSVCDVPEIIERGATPATSIPIDFERMGFVAARALGESMSGKSAAGPIRIGPLLVTRRKSTAGRGRREPWILDAVATIRAEACAGLSVESLVARLAAAGGRPVSRRNFDRRFREAMGHTANEEILSVRLESVCALLAQTGVPVTALHGFCGFGCYTALDAQFRARFGMSMSRWRETNAR